MIFIEPCAGAAAVALRLLGLRPLTPYLGGKAQYADAIIAALGIGGRDKTERAVRKAYPTMVMAGN